MSPILADNATFSKFGVFSKMNKIVREKNSRFFENVQAHDKFCEQAHPGRGAGERRPAELRAVVLQLSQL